MKQVNDVGTTSVNGAESLLQTALQFHQTGNLENAKTIYLDVLRSHPEFADAWHLLGMVLFAEQQLDEAINCLKHALEFSPGHPDYLSNLGLVFKAKGNYPSAIEALELAIQSRPDSAEFLNNLGSVFLDLEKYETAGNYFSKALNIDPDLATALMNQANVWLKTGRVLDAENTYRQLLKQYTSDVDLLANLAESLACQGKWASAVRTLAPLIDSTVHPMIRLNYGRYLVNAGRNQDGVKQFHRLIETNPEFAKSYHYLGKSYFENGDLKKALHHQESAVELDPNDAYAMGSLGVTQLELGEVKKAENCFRKALEIRPDLHGTHSFLLFVMSGDPTIDQEKLFKEHVRWGKIHGNVATISEPPFGPQKDVLNIGYVSGDFKRHAVSSYFLPVLKSHDRNRYQIHCYAEINKPDSITDRIKSLSDRWNIISGLSDNQVAQKIAEDQIDILIDLSGHTAGNRLKTFAFRPAPIQMTWIGYPNTTGLENIDYRITCEIQNPVDEPSWHTEELIRMPISFCFERPVGAPEVAPIPPCIKKQFITFGSLHRPFKISAETLNTWAKILSRCSDSRMLLLNDRFTSESAETLLKNFESLGIDKNRVEIRDQLPDEHYLKTYDEIDIALDVTPWAGGTTTLESLWMGVPVIAFYGDRRSARSTAAIMNGIGHPELIAKSEPEYVKIAHELVNNIDRLKKFRTDLRQKTNATIVNAAKFTANLEHEFERVWKKHFKIKIQ